MIFVDAARNAVTCIGRLGENNARTIRINVSSILREFPGVEFLVLNKRPGDPDAYPVPPDNVTVDGTNVLWTVTSGDVARVGFGEFDVVATVGETIVKTVIYNSRIDRALDGSEDPPDPWESWVEEVKDDADRADAAADRAEAAAEQAEHIIDDTAGAGDTGKTWSADKLVRELSVATLEEVQEVIDSYEDEEDEGMVVEMTKATWSYISEDDADDIAAAFMAGKNVVLHFQPGDSTPGAYVQLVNYAPAGTGGHYPNEGFAIAKPAEQDPDAFRIVNLLNFPYVNANGKLEISVLD